jgi:hypothetical protein
LNFLAGPPQFLASDHQVSKMTTRALSQRLVSIAESWTKDPFRPNIQLSTLLQSLASHPRLTKRTVEDARLLHDHEMMKKVSQTTFYVKYLIIYTYSTPCHQRCCDRPQDLCITTDSCRDMTKARRGLVDHGGKSFSASGHNCNFASTCQKKSFSQDFFRSDLNNILCLRFVLVSQQNPRTKNPSNKGFKALCVQRVKGPTYKFSFDFGLDTNREEIDNLVRQRFIHRIQTATPKPMTVFPRKHGILFPPVNILTILRPN